MTTHTCFGPEHDPYVIVCFCVRGQDHTEDEFDVPVESEDDADD